MCWHKLFHWMRVEGQPNIVSSNNAWWNPVCKVYFSLNFERRDKSPSKKRYHWLITKRWQTLNHNGNIDISWKSWKVSFCQFFKIIQVLAGFRLTWSFGWGHIFIIKTRIYHIPNSFSWNNVARNWRAEYASFVKSFNSTKFKIPIPKNTS